MTAPLDDFHAHEALDRCDMVCRIVNDFLLEHPWVTAHPEIEALLNEASDKLSAAYQAIGTIRLQEEPT